RAAGRPGATVSRRRYDAPRARSVRPPPQRDRRGSGGRAGDGSAVRAPQRAMADAARIVRIRAVPRADRGALRDQRARDHPRRTDRALADRAADHADRRTADGAARDPARGPARAGSGTDSTPHSGARETVAAVGALAGAVRAARLRGGDRRRVLDAW